MTIQDPYAKRPMVSKRLVAVQLMVDPGKHVSELIGFDQSQHIAHAIGTGLDLANQFLYTLGLT